MKQGNEMLQVYIIIYNPIKGHGDCNWAKDSTSKLRTKAEVATCGHTL